MEVTTDRSPELVLAPQTILRPAADIPGAEANDLILDCSERRQHAKLVNAAVGALLEHFRTPTRLPDAIASMTRTGGIDPFDLLAEAAPLVEELQAAGILTTARSLDPLPCRFEIGAHFGAFRINKILRRTVDTEVAMATDADGRPVALKSLRHGATAEAHQAFLREIDMACLLSGRIAPEVMDVVADDVFPVLVTEWIEGLALDRYVQSCCTEQAVALALAHRVANAYSELHAHGILHGDIRPSNILIDGEGQVRLLDFGLSQWTGPEATKFSFELRCMEPEAADALIEGTLPRLTTAGEVCTLGLVLAEAVSGSAVRSLSPFRDEALQQISRGDAAIRTGLDALDAVLERATRALPARIPSMNDLRDALAGVAAPPAMRAVDIEPVQEASIDASFLLLRSAEYHSDPELLAAARRCLHVATQADVLGADTASPLYSPVARTLLHARAAYAARRFDQARARIAALPDLVSAQDGSAELFTGAAGDLAHLARFHDDFHAADGRVAGLADLLKDMLARQSRHLGAALSDLEEGRPTHLGMAHGVAGQIHAILLATLTLGQPLDSAAQDGLHTLASLAAPAGSALAWPGTVHPVEGQPATADHAPGWCSGTAGFLLLWIEAERACRDPCYRALADASARFTLGHPDRTPNLCCGLAGRATALSIYGRWIGSANWCEMARRMADSADRSCASSTVFRGRAGIDLARIETRSETPRFPV